MNHVPLVLALALALALPSATAHIVPFTQANPMSLGPYNALVQPKPDPMFANGALSMTAIFSRASDGTYASDLPAKLDLDGPASYHKTTQMQPDGTGYVVASVVVPAPGNYTAKITVNDSSGSYSNQTSFYAYPDLPVRIATEDPNQPDPTTNDSSFVIGITTVNSSTLERTDALSDLTLRLEHWSDDHRTLYTTTEVPMQHAGKGLWHAKYAFPLQGMFHLRFSSVSGGFKPDDVPILHVYARDPPASAKRVPGVELGAALVLAFALALVLRRR